MPSANPLELAKQGDPDAIAAILNYALFQHYSASTSVIRLGDYLSVFVETASRIEQEATARLVNQVLSELAIAEILTVEINAQQRGDRGLLWTQTLKAPFNATPAFSSISPLPNPGIDSNLSSERSAALVPMAWIEPKSQRDPAANEDGNSLQTVLQRPEIVAMVAMALLLVFWDTYMEWMDEAETQSISGRQLARHLGVSSSTISRYKERSNFSEWSQTLDPEGIAWVYTGKAFVPMRDGE